MSEVKITEHSVQMFIETADCHCGGEMTPTGEMLMSSPPRWRHNCRECGHQEVLSDKYPMLKYKRSF